MEIDWGFRQVALSCQCAVALGQAAAEDLAAESLKSSSREEDSPEGSPKEESPKGFAKELVAHF